MAKPNNKTNSLRKTFISKYFALIVVVIVSLVGFLIYSNTYNASFHLDDNFFIKDNSLIKDLSEFLSIKYWSNIYYRPVSTFSFILNYKIHGFNVAGYHFVNILIHIITSLVVYYLSYLLLSKSIYSDIKYSKERKMVSFFTAILFLSHPIQTQSVNYIVQRMTLLASLFYLLSVLTYFKARIYHLSGKLWTSFYLYLLFIMMFYLALFSKQTAATIPLVLLLVEVLFVRKANGKKAMLVIIIMSLLIFAGGLFVLLAGYLPLETQNISREMYFATQTRVVFNYIQLLFLPYPLNFDPSVVLSDSIFGLKEIAAIIGHIIILSVGVFFYKKNKIVTFGIFWFYITLLVESSIIPITDVMFEHRVYLPAYGFIFIITTILSGYILKKNGKTMAISIFIVIALVYSVMSFNRNKVWLTELSLWSSVIDNPPVKSRAYRYMGIEYIKTGKNNNALEALDQAIKLTPDRW